MQSEEPSVVKIIMLGDTETGKSSLILRYVENQFCPFFIPTVGLDFKTRSVEVDENKYKLQIWDTARHERYEELILSYYKKASIIVLNYDITRYDTFKSLDTYLSEIEKLASNPILIL